MKTAFIILTVSVALYIGAHAMATFGSAIRDLTNNKTATIESISNRPAVVAEDIQ
jgi:hypothetical protein